MYNDLKQFLAGKDKAFEKELEKIAEFDYKED